jgi:hypothetical protein
MLDGQVADERRGGDLLVERILRVRDTQAAPDLRHVGVERENRVAEALGDSREPARQRGCLVFVTAVPQLLDAAAELATIRPEAGLPKSRLKALLRASGTAR